MPSGDDFEDGAPRCGLCGAKKVKLPTKTTYNQLDVWVCTSNPPSDSKIYTKRFGLPVPCDGDAYRYSVWEWKDKNE